MSCCPKSILAPSGRNGVALVIVLSLVALVTILLVAFISNTGLDRSASVNYSQALKADYIAIGGLQLVVADLQREMGKDALPLTSGTETYYTNITGSNIQPQATGTASGIPTLIKMSGTAPTFTPIAGSSVNLSGTVLLSSTLSTSAASLNGRYISASRWSAPLFGDFTATGPRPSWIFVTRAGLASAGSFGSSGDTWNKAALSNSNYVVGRFAYAIYDEGGLLDVNVAGYPSSLTADQIQTLKRTLAGALLSGTGLPAPDTLVTWRNAGSGTNAAAYVNSITSATSGFLKTGSGNNLFLSRQDLIHAAKLGYAGLSSTAVLPNLTTFSREISTPSWGPTYNAQATGTYAYKNQALSTGTGISNRFLPSVRCSSSGTVTSYHDDGTPYTYPVANGSPLIQRRFSLGRLNWIGPDGPQNGGSAESIQACFGLVWGTSTTDDGRSIHLWKYVGASGSTEQSTIKSLAEIAAEPNPREPNFFELLNAGILAGSLAVSGTGPGGGLASLQYTAQASKTLQVLRVGASIIDQYDSDSKPTVIEYNQSGLGWQACGVEDLPYVNTLVPVVGDNAATTGTLAVYFLFGLWNPHQQIQTLVRPNVRLRASGDFCIYNPWADPTRYTTNFTGVPSGITTYGYYTAFNTTLELANVTGRGANGFSAPSASVSGLITINDIANPVPDSNTSNGNATSGTWVQTYAIGQNNHQYVGLRMPDFVIPLTGTSSTLSPISMRFPEASLKPFTTALEYRNSAGEWVPYSYGMGINDQVNTGLCNPTGSTYTAVYMQLASLHATVTSGTYKILTTPWLNKNNSIGSSLDNGYMFMTCDPRSTRFGWWIFDRQRTSDALNSGEDSRLWSEHTDTAYTTAGYGKASSSVSHVFYAPKIFDNNGVNYWPATLAKNNAANSSDITAPNSSYADKDGLRRLADSGYFPASPSATYSTGNPYFRPEDRPSVLNRPFRSVAELGYAFRDDPWRSLDFFSSSSADAGLLDLFCVAEENVHPGDPRSDVVAGKINLNSRNVVALTSVINGTMADLLSTGTVGRPSNIAAALVALTGSNPLVNKSELATRLSPALSSSEFSDTDEEKIKSRREVCVRALTDVGQTRTWNLMIDLIAQAGKFPASANNPAQFVVEGERRYWMHVAIDRFTGKVIDHVLEPVSE